MAHPWQHARSSAKKFGGSPCDYEAIHNWFDETKGWVAHSKHRMFRHHSEGIFECEKRFGMSITNSEGEEVFVRYIGEQHVREDCNGYIPTAKEWIDGLNDPPIWMLKTQKLND